MLLKLKVGLAGLLGAAVIALATCHTVTAEDKKDKKDAKVPSVKDIMIKGHKGADAHIGKIKASVKGEKWDDAKEYATTLAGFGVALGKNKPTKGTQESWDAASKKYAESTAAVLAAVEKKDAAATNKALGTIDCAGCHKAHK